MIAFFSVFLKFGTVLTEISLLWPEEALIPKLLEGLKIQNRFLNKKSKAPIRQKSYDKLFLILFKLTTDNAISNDSLTIKKPKTGNTKMITFCHVIQDSKTVFYKFLQNFQPVKLFLRKTDRFSKFPGRLKTRA